MLDMDQRSNQASAKSVSRAASRKSDWRISVIHPMKMWRLHNKISLEKMSMETGMSASSLSRIERYKQTPLIGAAQKIIAFSKNALKPEDFFS